MSQEHFDVSYGSFVSAVGCDHCGDTGYNGRIGIYEVLFINDEIRHLIINKASVLDIRKKAVEMGCLRLLREAAFQKVCEGLTTIEEAYSKIMD